MRRTFAYAAMTKDAAQRRIRTFYEAVMYHEYFTEEHTLLRRSLASFIAREIDPYLDEWEEAESFPRDLYIKMAAAGFLGMTYPEEYGGVPADIFMAIAYTEEMMKAGSAGLVAGLGSHAIALPPILALGNEEQKRRFVPPVLAGKKIAALAVTEPGAGSDVAAIRTRAVKEGDYYRVNGAKTFITSGCRADFLTCAARTGGDGYPGISLLLVESSTPGFAVNRKIKKLGWWVSDTAELSFADCLVPRENLLGEEGSGFAGLMANFVKERLSLAVMAHATAQVALDWAIKYARQREAFGRPLTGFQVIRHQLADMAAKVDVAREYNYRTAARIGAGLNAIAQVAIAKNFASQICEEVVSQALQIHGGYGYAREYRVERLYRDARILSIGGGTTEIMKEILTRDLFSS